MRRSLLTIEPTSYHPHGIQEFMESRGAGWHAPREVVQRAASALTHLVESVIATPEPHGVMHFVVSFNACHLDIEGRYRARSGRRCVVNLGFDH